MCGLGGYIGIPQAARLAVAVGLGHANDSRGGHASGYGVRRADGGIHLGKKLGKWKDASNGFLQAAASGDMSLIHARWATCGDKTVDEAHPFAVKRDGFVKLWGMHNGVIYSARESAKKHDRKFSVDSFELLNLLADNSHAEIHEQEGYGTLVWVRRDDINAVRLTKMTDDADLLICQVQEGGFIWGSTWAIVEAALSKAGLHTELRYELTTGVAYRIDSAGLCGTHEEVKLKERRYGGSRRYSGVDYSGYSGEYGGYSHMYGGSGYGGSSHSGNHTSTSQTQTPSSPSDSAYFNKFWKNGKWDRKAWEEDFEKRNGKAAADRARETLNRAANAREKSSALSTEAPKSEKESNGRSFPSFQVPTLSDFEQETVARRVEKEETRNKAIVDWREASNVASKPEGVVETADFQKLNRITVEEFEYYADDDLALIYDLKESDVRTERTRRAIALKDKQGAGVSPFACESSRVYSATCRICSLTICDNPDDKDWHCFNCTLHIRQCLNVGCGKRVS